MKKQAILALAAGLLLSLKGWGHHPGEDTTEAGRAASPIALALEKITDIPLEREEAVKEPIFKARVRMSFLLDQMALMPLERKLVKGPLLPRPKNTPSSGVRAGFSQP